VKGIEESHFTSFYISWCWLYIVIEEDNLFICYCICRRLDRTNLTSDILDVDYSIYLALCPIRSCITWIFYTTMHWFYYWFYIKWINHHVAIIVPSTHHRSTNSTVYQVKTTEESQLVLQCCWRANLHPSIHYLLLNLGKARLETLENSQQVLSPLKPIKNMVKREVVKFYIARRAAVKNAVYCNRI
jgi:hypothetical protein